MQHVGNISIILKPLPLIMANISYICSIVQCELINFFFGRQPTARVYIDRLVGWDSRFNKGSVLFIVAGAVLVREHSGRRSNAEKHIQVDKKLGTKMTLEGSVWFVLKTTLLILVMPIVLLSDLMHFLQSTLGQLQVILDKTFHSKCSSKVGCIDRSTEHTQGNSTSHLIPIYAVAQN